MIVLLKIYPLVCSAKEENYKNLYYISKTENCAFLNWNWKSVTEIRRSSYEVIKVFVNSDENSRMNI